MGIARLICKMYVSAIVVDKNFLNHFFSDFPLKTYVVSTH